MLLNAHQVGRTIESSRWAEQKALELLHTKDWCLISRNWRCRWGELDLVLHKGDQLLVVEVKGRSSGHQDRNGLDAFHQRKRRRLACAIDCWRAAHPGFQGKFLRVVLALVPLMRSNRPVIWLDVERLC